MYLMPCSPMRAWKYNISYDYHIAVGVGREDESTHDSVFAFALFTFTHHLIHTVFFGVEYNIAVLSKKH